MLCEHHKIKNLIKFICIMVVFVVLLQNITTLKAESYTPNDLYDIDYIELDNGLGVYLQERHHTKSVAIRIAVEVGNIDFTCNVRETPHFLEHLLFTGTNQYTEDEIDKKIKNYGGYLNATTENYITVYESSVHSKFVIETLDLFFNMFTESTFSKDNIKTTREIVYRESDGRSSYIKRWLYDRNFFKSGSEKTMSLVYSEEAFCPSLTNLEKIHDKEIFDAFKNYYVPNNMAIFLVGDFDKTKIKNHLLHTFAKLVPGKVKRRKMHNRVPILNGQTVTSTLKPILGDEAIVTFTFRKPGKKSADYIPSLVLGLYLDKILMSEIRTKRGMSYSPGVYSGSVYWMGYFEMIAKVELSDVKRTIDVIRDIIKNLHNQKFKQVDLDELKNNILLSLSKGYERNADFINTYTAMWRLSENRGDFEGLENKINKITTEDMDRIISQYFKLDNTIIILDKPTISYTQLFFVAFLLGIFIFYQLYRRIRHYKIIRVA